jgi:cytochrome b involved in lipid metabolism
MGWIKGRPNESHASSGRDVATSLEHRDKIAPSLAIVDVADEEEDEEASSSNIHEHPASDTTACSHSKGCTECLPLLSTAEVMDRCDDEAAPLWIVVDNIVYDCSEYVLRHPGGEQVIQSFKGRDCSWQFWRFHGAQQMEEWATPLRIARVEGVPNPFREPKRWVGLRKLGTLDDDW